MAKRIKLEILYEDQEVLVCVKPAGVAVQTAKAGQSDLVSELKNYRARRKEEPYIGLVHRLDQPVKGVMVFAKTKQAAAALSKQVSDRSVDKEYMAVVCGDLASPDRVLPQKGELKDYLLRDGKTNISAVVPKGTPGGKEARLSYEVLASNPDSGRALVHIQLHTGRHHQIRVQFAHAGFPLYGDTKYGELLSGGRYQPVALCSCLIRFAHPKTGKNMEYRLDIQQEMRELL